MQPQRPWAPARRSAAHPTAWMSWSSGKDSAMALAEVRAAGDVEVTTLLTTVDGTAERVSIHGVRRSLLEAQADALGLGLLAVELPSPCPNAVYEDEMRGALEVARADGATHMVFGDIHLDDVRRYREAQLEGTGIVPVFPLWGRPTRRLAGEILAAGIDAVVTCVDTERLPRDLAGRAFDAALLDRLPAGVDPCGENGELHTFVRDAPGFRAPIRVERGEVVERGGFAYCDLLDASGTAGPSGA